MKILFTQDINANQSSHRKSDVVPDLYGFD